LPAAEIAPLLDHPRWDVRAAAVEALRGRGGEVAAEALARHRRREIDPLVLRLLDA
jgi:HEAT repeat protein